MLALAWTAVIAFSLYAVLATVTYMAQRSLMYFPDTAHVVPAEAGLPEAEEVPLTAADGVRVGLARAAARRQTGHRYFHGNGGALHFRVARFRKNFIADGVGLVALEYRGYGSLAGAAQRTRADCRCASRLSFRGGALPAATACAVG